MAVLPDENVQAHSWARQNQSMKAPQRKTIPVDVNGNLSRLVREALTQDALEPLSVQVIEGRGTFRVDVEDSDQAVLSIQDRNNDLADRVTIAGDMPGKCMDIGHNLGLAGFRRSPTNTLAKRDPKAA